MTRQFEVWPARATQARGPTHGVPLIWEAILDEDKAEGWVVRDDTGAIYMASETAGFPSREAALAMANSLATQHQGLAVDWSEVTP